MKEIAMPEGNEEEFLKIGERLGIKEITFAYCAKDSNDASEIRERTEKLKDKAKIKISFALILDKKSLLSMKKYGKAIIRSEREDDRWIIEKGKPDMIYGLEHEKSKDRMHQRDSGLNEVMCKIMKKNEITYVINYNWMLNLEKAMAAQAKGRTMQNIRLARKYKIKVKIASMATSPYQMRSEHDLAAFFVALGMHAKEAKDALNL